MGQLKPAQDFEAPPAKGLKLSSYYTNRAAAYWREGLDTAQIAQQMNISEAHIWNNMDAVKGKQPHD